MITERGDECDIEIGSILRLYRKNGERFQRRRVEAVECNRVADGRIRLRQYVLVAHRSKPTHQFRRFLHTHLPLLDADPAGHSGQLDGHLGRHPTAGHAYATQRFHHQFGHQRLVALSADHAADAHRDRDQVLAHGRFRRQLQIGRWIAGSFHFRVHHIHHGQLNSTNSRCLSRNPSFNQK